MKQQNSHLFLSLNLRMTAEALEWLSGTTTDNDGKEIPNMALFSYLLKDMRIAAGYDDSFRRPLNLKPGQMQFSEISLAERWNLGRKKTHNLLSRMEAVGLVGIYNSRVGSALSFTCVSCWDNTDGETVINGFFTD